MSFPLDFCISSSYSFHKSHCPVQFHLHIFLKFIRDLFHTSSAKSFPKRRLQEHCKDITKRIQSTWMTPFVYLSRCIHSDGLPWWLSSKDSTCTTEDAGDVCSIPGLGRSPGGGHGNPLQYSCLGNPMDRGAWQATVHRVTNSQTRQKRLSMNACIHSNTMI